MFLILAALDFFTPLNHTGLLQCMYVLYLVTAGIYILLIYRDLFFLFSAKPVLSINENQIHDHYNDVVYDWGDIEATRQKYGYLYLKLYHPEDYLNKIGNPHYRMIRKLWYKPGSEHNEFLINLGLADANKDELSNLVTGYSIHKKN